jgi:hypothetical protein
MEYQSVIQKSTISFEDDLIELLEGIELSLKDFLYIHQTICEYIRFFHQPLHYKNHEDVNRFLGSFDSGALSALHKCCHKIFTKYIPEDICSKKVSVHHIKFIPTRPEDFAENFAFEWAGKLGTI